MSTFLYAAILTLLSLALSTVRAVDDLSLLPAVHWDHDKADLQHLVPVDNHNLYFAADGAAGKHDSERLRQTTDFHPTRPFARACICTSLYNPEASGSYPRPLRLHQVCPMSRS